MRDEHISPETALLINLPDGELHVLRDLLMEMAPATHVTCVSSLGDVCDSLLQTAVVLIVIHCDSAGREALQAVQKTRRSLRHRPPILLLVPPDRTEEIRTYLREGADEFWILPMDPFAFPARLEVLLQWGRSAEEIRQIHEATPQAVRSNEAPLLSQVWMSIRSLLGRHWERRNRVKKPAFFFGGRWERIRRLGFGSFGEVVLVRARKGSNIAVAKIPHGTGMNAHFLREAAILKRLAAHPRSVRLLEVIDDNGKAVIIEEYVEGASLQEVLNRGMESRQKERTFLELLDFVAFAHNQKIMHRDIKPENIIVTPSGNSRLLDFGAAKDLSRMTTSSTVIGSRPYMAPEQISGRSEVASDVWALGVLLYTLATGLLPFYDDNEKKLMDMILESEPQAPRSLEPDLPEAMEQVILKCLRKDSQMRYGDAGALKDELLRLFPRFGDGGTLPDS